MSMDCESKICVYTFSLLLNLDNLDHSGIVFNYSKEDSGIVCQTEGKDNFTPKKYGRNWSMFLKRDQLYFSFQFLPHQVIRVNDGSRCQLLEHSLSVNVPDISRYFYTFGKEYRFSLGSPAIPYNEKEYIAVGHSRFNIIGYQGISPISTLNYSKFIKEKIRSKDNIDPLMFYYFMYFYTFDRDTFEIMRMSQSFTPTPHDPYWLVFAAGITYAPYDSFMISYGEGDIRCKVITLSRKMIESMLLPIDYMLKSPEIHDFIEI